MGHVGSKTRSLGQIIEKPCVRSIGHIFSPIVMKLDQNVCLYEFSDNFEKTGHVRSKTRSLGQILEKTLLRPHFQFDDYENWSEYSL